MNWKLINAIKEDIDNLTEDEKVIVKDYIENKPAPTYSIGGLMVRHMIENYEKQFQQD